MPFEDGSFDLAYSAGLFHELDVRKEPAERALEALVRMIRPGGRISTGDFVDTVPSLQVEEESLQADLLKELFGSKLYGIGSPERLVTLHEKFLTDIRWSVSPPHRIRHLSKLFLNEEPPAFHLLAPNTARAFRMRYGELRERVRREGFTRPASLYVEGIVDG
jgi:SAM-dependent methyltransferase